MAVPPAGGGRYNAAMPLPVLKSSSIANQDDLVRFFHKIELEYDRHLGDETQLDCGNAIASAELPGSNNANCIVDASLPPGMPLAAVYQLVKSHFESAGSTCRRWVLNPSAPIEQTKPLADDLPLRGYVRQSFNILHLPRLPQSPVREVAGLKVVPARASYRHVRALAEEESAELADAAMLHLDDPRFDALLALKDSQAV